MGAKDFFSQGWPTRLAFYLGKYAPPHGGRLIAGLAARTLVTLNLDVSRAVYDNQRHVLGAGATAKQLRRNVYEVFFNAARSYYELFHNVGRGRLRVEDFQPPMRLLPETQTYLREALQTGRGVFIVGVHSSNFDLAGIALSQFMPVPLQVLSLADPAPGFEMFNRLREHAGAMITPITSRSLREAMVRLREGGAVITGVERPIGTGDAPVKFFGATAQLPAGYLRIPLRAGSLVITLACFFEEGEYRVYANPPLEMVHTGDRQQDIDVNLRQVLTQIEDLIRRHPEQWMMFVPVWKPDGA